MNIKKIVLLIKITAFAIALIALIVAGKERELAYMVVLIWLADYLFFRKDNC